MNQETPLQGVQLSFYCHTRARHDGVLMYEWLLERAKKNGIGGGSAFRASAASAGTACCTRSSSSNWRTTWR
jgi:PII-like signaling protein